jgi:hypothetical protein
MRTGGGGRDVAAVSAVPLPQARLDGKLVNLFVLCFTSFPQGRIH